MIHTDTLGNKWVKITFTQAKKYVFKNNKFVWYLGCPNCSWTTPHIAHKESLNHFLSKHSEFNGQLWLLKKRATSQVTKAAWIGFTGAILAALIGVYDKYNITSSVPIIIKKDSLDLPINKIWEFEDSEGVYGNDTIRVKVAYKIITDEFRWKLGSYDSLDNNKDIKEVLPQYASKIKDFKKALGLISVGSASEEGILNREIDRADRRADNINLSLKLSTISSNKNLYKLNLGQYKFKTGAKDLTSYQRKIVIIGIMNWSSDSNNLNSLKFALLDALSKIDGISYNPKNYSNFDFTSYDIDYERILIKH